MSYRTNDPVGGDLSGNESTVIVTTISGAVPVNVANSVLSFGATPATSGNIRLGYGHTITALDNAGTTVIQLLTLNGTDQVTLGDGNHAALVSLEAATGASHQMKINGAVQFTLNTSNIQLTPATLEWANTVTSPTVSQVSTASTPATNLTIAPQQSTTATNRTDGSAIIALGPGLGSGTPAGFQITAGGGNIMKAAYGFVGSTGNGTIWLGSAGSLNSTQFSLSGDGNTFTIVNAPNGGNLYHRINNTTFVNMTTSAITYSLPTLQWDKTQSAVITQQPQTTDTATTSITISPQAAFASATSTNRIAGNLIANISAPTNSGTTEAGFVMQRGGISLAAIQGYPGFATTIGALYLGSSAATAPGSTNMTLYNDNSLTAINGQSSISFQLGGTVYSTLNASNWIFIENLTFDKNLSNPSFIHTTKTTDVAATNFSVQAQSAFSSASTNKNGGNLILTGGTAASGGTAGQVQINSPIQLQTNVFNDATVTAIATTDATLTTVYTDSAIASSAVYDYVVTVVGVGTSSLDVYRADFSFTVLNTSGTLGYIGASPVALNVRGTTTGLTWGGASIAISTTHILVQVTGKSATNIDWNCSINRVKVV